MGMFDDIIYKGKSYQTKSLNCTLDTYKIEDDGTLWFEDYDIEDHSDPNAKGKWRSIGMLTKVNERWVQLSYTGEIRFYGVIEGAEEYSAYFVEGKLTEFHDVSVR